MPQDSLKSVVYRSLVHCDDPNGVVENETIRRSKINPKKVETKTKTRRTHKGSNSSLVYKEERNGRVSSEDISEELQAPHSFELLEVSRGAHKLNQMIDTWSNGTVIDGQSEDIARDLLRGALDLQESLIMLCKMQEASKFMSQLKKKQELQLDLLDEVGVERVDSGRFGEGNYARSLQNSRFSIGGSSRNCTEELKKVIRESLSRQNLLPVSSDEEKVPLNQMKFDSVLDIPSTSSSHSSVVLSNDFASVGSSSSSTTRQMKAKSPSVIAKLMGLEEFPSELIPSPPKQLLDDEKNLNRRRPISDIELLKARKPAFVNQGSDSERRTLKEIIETMKVKGLLQSKSHVERLNFGSHHPKKSIPKHMSDDEMPPVVLIKPLRFPSREAKGFIEKEEASYFKEKSLKMEAKEEHSSKRFAHNEVPVAPKVTLHKMEAEDEPASKDTKVVEILEPKKMSGKLEAKEESPARRLTREDGNLMSNQILRKQRPKELKIMEKTSKMKASVAQNHKPEKIEKTNNKVGRMQKTLPNRRKPVEKEITKASTAARSLDHVRANSTKPRKLENGSIISRDRIHPQQSTTPNPVLKRTIKPISQNAIDRTKRSRPKRAKPVRDSLLDTSVTDTSQHKDEGMSSVSSATSTLLDNQHPTKDGRDTTKVKMEDAPICLINHKEEEDQTVFSEVTTEATQEDIGIYASEEAKQLVDHKTAFPLAEIDLKRFFLSSPSFISSAEELFNLNIKQSMILQTTLVQDIGTINTRLYLDCANELMEHKSRWSSRVVHPLIRTRLANPGISMSLDGLVEELCEEIDILRSYSEVDEDNVVPVDNLFKMLENDLKKKEVLGNGGWDLGWVNGFSVNEADQVVGEMGKQVLSELIDEFIIDLVF